MGKVTLKQLADELGVASATVSMALRNDPSIAAATRARVRALAEARDYVQSNLGRALQAGRTRIVGCLIHGVTQTFYNEILQGIGDGASDAGYGVLTAWIRPEPVFIEHQVRLMLEKDVDAVIVVDRRGLVEPYAPKFLRCGKPLVFCAAAASAPGGCAEVRNDDLTGGRLAVELLARYGHRHVLGCSLLAERLQGNRMAAAGRGIELTEFDSADAAAERALADPTVTGIAAYCDEQALDILYRLRQAGVRVPEEVSLVGFNGSDIGARPEFKLTTVAQQRRELGAAAFALACEGVEKTFDPPRRIMLEPLVVERGTVAFSSRIHVTKQNKELAR